MIRQVWWSSDCRVVISIHAWAIVEKWVLLGLCLFCCLLFCWFCWLLFRDFSSLSFFENSVSWCDLWLACWTILNYSVSISLFGRLSSATLAYSVQYLGQEIRRDSWDSQDSQDSQDSWDSQDSGDSRDSWDSQDSWDSWDSCIVLCVLFPSNNWQKQHGVTPTLSIQWMCFWELIHFKGFIRFIGIALVPRPPLSRWL